MIVGIYSVRDDKADQFLPPFFVKSDMVAARMFIDAVGSESNKQFMEHAEDFSLVILGTFDDETGEIVPRPPEEILSAEAAVRLRAAQVRKREQKAHDAANAEMIEHLSNLELEEVNSGRS